MCYMAGAPAKSGGTFKKRGQPYLIVTDRGVKADEISASAGYPLKSATLELDGKATPLMTENDIAWAHDLDEDMKLVGLLKRKGNVTLRGVSQKGTISDDSYALAGFEQAYDAMKALCQ